MRLSLPLALVCLSLGVAACAAPGSSMAPKEGATVAAKKSGSGGTGGGGVVTTPTLDARFLHPAAAAPGIANPEIKFWAYTDAASGADMYYRPRAGQSDSTIFLRFRIKSGALTQDATGRPLVRGDSLLITMTLVDPVNQIVEFQPAGLRFSGSHPADLKFNYLESSVDVDGAPIVGTNEAVIAPTFRVGIQERTTDPWGQLVSGVTTGLHEVEAEIAGFTRYAIVY